MTSAMLIVELIVARWLYSSVIVRDWVEDIPIVVVIPVVAVTPVVGVLPNVEVVPGTDVMPAVVVKSRVRVMAGVGVACVWASAVAGAAMSWLRAISVAMRATATPMVRKYFP